MSICMCVACIHAVSCELHTFTTHQQQHNSEAAKHSANHLLVYEIHMSATATITNNLTFAVPTQCCSWRCCYCDFFLCVYKKYTQSTSQECFFVQQRVITYAYTHPYSACDKFVRYPYAMYHRPSVYLSVAFSFRLTFRRLCCQSVYLSGSTASAYMGFAHLTRSDNIALMRLKTKACFPPLKGQKSHISCERWERWTGNWQIRCDLSKLLMEDRMVLKLMCAAVNLFLFTGYCLPHMYTHFKGKSHFKHVISQIYILYINFTYVYINFCLLICFVLIYNFSADSIRCAAVYVSLHGSLFRWRPA